MNHAIPDVATARRCIDALADYLGSKDDSPRAAADLRESVRILSAQPNWQPIESAPKDGTRIVLHVQDEDGPVVAFWEGGWSKMHAGEEFYVARKATHWMPLPAPPETP